MSLCVLLDSLPRCWTIVSVFSMGRCKMSKDEDGETRNELHGGQTQLRTTVATMSRSARAPGSQQWPGSPPEGEWETGVTWVPGGVTNGAVITQGVTCGTDR